VKPPRPNSALPPQAVTAGCTSMHFGENQLSPCSIGISPLPTPHPRTLQRSAVRPFTPCYGRCSLGMGGSHGFGSAARHGCRASHPRVRSASGWYCLKQATRSNSSGHTPKGTRSRWAGEPAPSALTAWTRSVSGSVSLPSPGYFSPFPHGTLRYRSRPVGWLGRWSARLPTGLHVSRGTRATSAFHDTPRYRTVTCCGAPSQTLPVAYRIRWRHASTSVMRSQPRCRKAWRLGTATVWPAARFARHYYGPATTSCG
jgi:hypothetical protein